MVGSFVWVNGDRPLQTYNGELPDSALFTELALGRWWEICEKLMKGVQTSSRSEVSAKKD
jgi:hypothetical protein